MNPKVTLLSHTKDPIETIFQIWELSKSNRPAYEIKNEAYCCAEASNSKCLEKRAELFQKIIDSKIPVAENLQFIFLLENVSISFREQMVRHRIGVRVGERLGADLVPDLADSTWWSQSMRILDMGSFASKDSYRKPEFPNEEAERTYESAMYAAQSAYNHLIHLGMKMEDAREVIPLGATHRITWGLNLAALIHIIGKRSCWILQGDLWEPIITGMINELVNNIDPIFRTLAAPPCVSGGKYVGCKFKLDNERRVSGEDKLPPCKLYLDGEKVTWDAAKSEYREQLLPMYDKMSEKYEKLWGKTCEQLTRNS